MMNIQKITLIFILGLTAFSCGKKEKQVDEGIMTEEVVISETVSTAVFQQKMSESTNAAILDVRTPEEFMDGYIEGADNVDFRASDFQTKVSALDKNATYFVYCASGGRSRDAADLMKEMGFKNVYDLAGGFKGWSQKGLPAVLPQN
ncbi:MAG: rhodanese-like domain-containing protein [Cyclobacteriaceae bacterium]